MFSLFDGSTVEYEEEGTVYPHFINEAAYKASAVAFATADNIW